MTITTKAALADELGISRARVSQYVKAGLPVRSDGKLNRDEALNWLRLNQCGLNSEERGASRAARLARQAAKRSPVAKPEAPAAPTSQHEAMRLALVWAFRLHPRIVAASVLEAGGSIETAFAAAAIAHSPTIQNSVLVLRHLGHPDFQDDDDEALGLLASATVEPDWHDLAERGGLAFDRRRCEAHLDQRPSWASAGDDDDRIFETDFTLADLTAGTP